jgi:alanine-alpha-ketoisovalerate/valine-pyruvate aminotransferase
LRLLKGEYFYHQIQARLLFKDRFEWLDKDTLAKGDVVVMSCPFSDTGNVPDNLDDILTVCDRLDVPVMLDMAYISMSDIKHLDLSHQCIKVLTTSLSKIFPVEQHRIGLRMRREFKDDTLVAYNQNQYVNRHSVNIGNHMIKTFSNDWLVDRYKQRQQDLCRRLEVVPSSCVIFGIDHDHHFNEYNRGGASNRLCFSKVFDGRSS